VTAKGEAMFFRHHTDKLIYPLLVVVLLTVVSYRPTYHLRREMPDSFFTSSASDSTPKRALDKKIASAYWESAQRNIQWRYPHGHPLPPDAPAEFNVDVRALAGNASDPTTRALYWHRLQQVWPLPEAWNKRYEWDWSWVSDPLASSSQWMKDTWQRWFTMHGPR